METQERDVLEQDIFDFEDGRESREPCLLDQDDEIFGNRIFDFLDT